MKENKTKQITVDIGKLFRIDPNKIQPEINHVHYSNVAYIQVNPRDTIIDFLQMPGLPDDDTSIVKTTRIYLSHIAAKRLAETILTTLDTALDSEGIEIFPPANKKKGPKREPHSK